MISHIIFAAPSISRPNSNGFLTKKTPISQPRPSVYSGSSALLWHAKQGSKSFDGGSRSFDKGKVFLNGTVPNCSLNTSSEGTGDGDASKGNPDEKPNEVPDVDTKDSVSGLLYDMLQREVIASCFRLASCFRIAAKRGYCMTYCKERSLMWIQRILFPPCYRY